LDVQGVSQANGAQIIQWDCHNGKNQDFAVTYQGNQIILTAQNSHKAVTISGGNKNNGANAQQQPVKNLPEQKFIVKPKGNNKYLLVFAHSNKCLDVLGWGKHNGANIIQVNYFFNSYIVGLSWWCKSTMDLYF